MNLLVVQEEPPVASFIKRGLEAEGFVVRTACDGAEGLEMSRSADLDLIVLDLVLPTVTGEEILARLRAAGSSVPVIVLTSGDAVADQVAILNAGADDFVTRPCSLSELLARIRARLRAADQTVSTTISHGSVTIDVATRDVRIGGSSVDLTPREFALLEMLMRHAGSTVTRPELLSEVWSLDFDPRSNLVDVYVRYLRRKLGPAWITTERGVGYRIVDPKPEPRTGAADPRRSAQL